MSDAIKNERYFEEGFRELDTSLADTTAMLANALPLDEGLRALVPWQEGKEFPASIPAGNEREGAQLLSICFELLNIVEERVAWKFRSTRRATHGAAAIKGLWPAVINRLVDEGLTEMDVIAALQKVRVEKLNEFRQWLVATLLLSVLFLVVQIPALLSLLMDRQADHATALSAFLFFLILLHALHVVGGIVPLFKTTLNAYAGRYDHEHYGPVKMLTMYWHFLDAVWILMFGVFLALG